MAGPNRQWEATDVIRDPQLPRRRLTSVAIGGQFCLLFYEHGGIGKNDNVAAFRISEDHAEPIWHAYVTTDVRNPTARERNHLLAQRRVAFKDLRGGRPLAQHIGNQIHRNTRPFEHRRSTHNFWIAGDELP